MSEAAAELRLFVAVELPEEVIAALRRLQDTLRLLPGLDGLRWVRPEGIHLTLKFLGETPASRSPEIEAALASAVTGHAPHRLALGKLGTFGGRSSPRVLWVGVEGDVEAAMALQASVDDALAPLGFPKEARGFSPHLTLARARPESGPSIAAPLAAAIAACEAPARFVDVREVSLMRSTLGRGGAVYNRMKAFVLA